MIIERRGSGHFQSGGNKEWVSLGFINVEVKKWKKKLCHQHGNVLVSLVFENKYMGRQLNFDVLHGDRHFEK